MTMTAVTGKSRLSAPEIERALIKVAFDLKEILVVDDIDITEAPRGFCIRCHDLLGVLPDIVVVDTGDRYAVLDGIIREGAKRIVMVRVRKELEEIHGACEFLLPTSTEKGKLVGFRTGEMTVLAEAPTFWEAYYELWRNAAGTVT